MNSRVKEETLTLKENPHAIESSSNCPLSIWGHFSKKVATSSNQQSTSSMARAVIEVQRYLEEDLLDREEDPLKWWQNNGYNYPNLSKVARDKFGTVATSVPCERVFSKSGELLTSRRSRISASEVQQVLFLNANNAV